jgi:hypothetical protein
MIRKGKYAIHNGSDYSLSLLEDKSIRLIRNKYVDLTQGFKHLDENIYIKNVSVEEVDLFKINQRQYIRERCFQHLKKEELEKYFWIQQTLNLLKGWVLNRQINICTPNLWNGMK